MHPAACRDTVPIGAPTGPARSNTTYEQEVDPVVELQLEKAGVRLAWLLNGALHGCSSEKF